MNPQMQIIKNGKIFTEGKWIENGVVIIRGKYIDSISSMASNLKPTRGEKAKVFDAGGNFIVPGLIDTHTYGAGGYDTHTGGVEALLHLRRIYPRYGVTAFLPSVPASPCEDIEKAARASQIATLSTDPGATVLGLFSEGICVNPLKHGAQIQDPNVCSAEEFINLLYRYPKVFRIVTLAPEIPQCSQIFAACRNLGIIPSFGHSNADYELAVEAFRKGYMHVTHLFNAMSGIQSREPGAVGAALLDDRVFCEIIADGHHVHPAVVRIALRVKTSDKLILVTDSMHAAGTGRVGKMWFAGQEVEVTNEVALLPTGRPAASILTLDQAIRNVVEWNAATLEEALTMATQNPASLLSLEKRGKISPGYYADVVVLDKELQVIATWCNGELVYQR